MLETVVRCREILERVTPLKSDCGRLCGGACCASQQGEETGMLLFAGEEALYRGLAGYRITEAQTGSLLICSGVCRREERPLSCRIFPLLPVVREGAVRVAMDARAKVVCPLHGQGVSAMDAVFVEAVRACGQLLLEDEEQRPMLERLTHEHDELRRLQKAFAGR